MFAVADTKKLVTDGIINAAQAEEIEHRAREAMITLAINAVLCLGILAATGGFILWLADPLSVAVLGSLMLAAGIAILYRGSEMFRMFGNAAALIGAGMLIGGAVVELLSNYEDIAGWVMTAGGVVTIALSVQALTRNSATARFVLGAILLIGVALHLGGLAFALYEADLTEAIKPVFFLYAASVIAAAGWFVDVRLVTALAIVPFAQVLETGTGYFHAAYVFYSPEPTLTILQMAALIALCLWIAQRHRERLARHARVLAVLAFVSANLCALVGSLWGDVVGETLWGPDFWDFAAAAGEPSQDQWELYREARDAFRSHALVIHEHVFSVLWAIALAAMVFWSAHRNNRGLFNAAMTFGAIHAYTQFFETFADEPLAYVIGGLAAIPLAWGIWRLNGYLIAKRDHPANGPVSQ